MKTRFFQMVLLAMMLVLAAPISFSGSIGTGEYGECIGDVCINDFSNETPLYVLFNKYFEDQLDVLFTSSNDLYNSEFGVDDPNALWAAENAQLVGAYRIAKLNHELYLIGYVDGQIGSVLSLEYTGDKDEIIEIVDPSKYVIEDSKSFYWNLVALDGNTPVEGLDWLSYDGNRDEMIHMLAFNVTGLYNLKTCGDETGQAEGCVKDAYMFAWEDLTLGKTGKWIASDWDYQDFVGIFTNIGHGGFYCLPDQCPPEVPEPGTIVLLGTGIVGLGLIARRKLTRK
jgi:hypothetical protein